MGGKAGTQNIRPGRRYYVLAVVILFVGAGLCGYMWLCSAINALACIIAGVIFFPLAETFWPGLSESDIMMWKGYVVLIGSWFIGITMIVIIFKQRRQAKRRIRRAGVGTDIKKN